MVLSLLVGAFVTDADLPAPLRATSDQLRQERDTAVAQPQPELPHVVTELLAVVRFITAVDGPLQVMPDPQSRLSPWHRPLLLKAQERLEVIDADLRGRVAFFVAARDHGFRFCDGDLELGRAALDTGRATTLVVEALLAGRLPTDGEFESMGDTALGIYAAIERRSGTDRRLDRPAGLAGYRGDRSDLQDRRRPQPRRRQAG